MLLNNYISWANHALNESLEAKSYLNNRGVSVDIANVYDLGFSIGDYRPSPVLDKNHSDACESKDTKCDTCRFIEWIDRSTKSPKIVLPLTSYSGSVLGVQTRNIKEKIYDTFLLNRRPECYYFGLSNAIQKIWSRKYTILVEGPFDCLVLAKFTDHPVLSITTNSTNENQTRFLNRFINTAYIFLDQDKAGRDGTLNIINKTQGLNHVKLELPSRYGCKDVNDLWKKLGDDDFRRIISQILSHVI